MDIRALQVLELPKVLEYLAGFAVSEAGREACLSLRPFDGPLQAGEASGLFEQGRLWLMRTQQEISPFSPLDAFLAHLGRPKAMLDLEDLWELRRMLAQASRLHTDILAGEADGGWPLWIGRCRSMPMPERSISGLTRCITDEGLLRDEASPELSLVRGELRRLHQQCIRKVKEYAAEYNITQYLQDTFMSLSSDRYVLPLKSNFKGRLQGVIHDFSQTGETCYFEPMFLVELNNRLQELKREEREEERKVILFLSALANEDLPGIRACYDFLVDLDLLRCRHLLGECFDGRMIPFEDGHGILLREARHPLLVLAGSDQARKALRSLRLSRQNGDQPGSESFPEPPARPVEVVPSTIELHPGQKAMVISGGNAGGKTVALKTLGLIAAMSLCALPVPVEAGSILPPWKRIHAFIGDEQSLDDHVSTFTAQISHLSRIWSELDRETLIILDEFGAGTDPSQGAALAQAVVDSLLEKGAFIVAATHFPALKAYALSTPGVRAASVLFDPKTRRPLFRLVYDQVGSSQALDVAREHGLPEEVLKRAGQYLLLNGEDTSALVDRLNTLAVEREQELLRLEADRRKLEEKRSRLQEKFERERATLFATIQEDARKIMAEWRASRISQKQALKELSKARAALVDQEDAEENSPAILDVSGLHPRQRVRHNPWKRIGLVQEVDTRKNRVRLDLDGVSLWADAADLSLPDEVPATGGTLRGGPVGRSQPPSTRPQEKPVANSSVILPLRLDLRGMRAELARNELEKFLDSAILNGRSVVEVIHGRGTGVLRRELHAFLRGHPAVGDFRLAPEDQGGDGMTIVELK